MTSPEADAVAAARMFPVMVRGYGSEAWIPWALVAPHEAQAQTNHSQSLERLAERGGCDAQEIAAILRDERWHERTARDEKAGWCIIAAAQAEAPRVAELEAALELHHVWPSAHPAYAAATVEERARRCIRCNREMRALAPSAEEGGE